MTVLPLFPLGTVLLPGGSLTLQLFEPRYVALLSDLLAAQEEQPPDFGVVAIRRGFEVGDDAVPELHGVGCTARITQVADLGDQRYVVVSEGRARFRLGAVQAGGITPYLRAEVQWLEEVSGDDIVCHALASRLAEEVAAYRDSLGVEPAPAPSSAERMSYWAPDVVDLGMDDRQTLLAARTTQDRLGLALRMVRRERGLRASLGTAGLPSRGPMSPN